MTATESIRIRHEALLNYDEQAQSDDEDKAEVADVMRHLLVTMELLDIERVSYKRRRAPLPARAIVVSICLVGALLCAVLIARGL